MMRLLTSLGVFAAFFVSTEAHLLWGVEISSPDGRLVVRFTLEDEGGEKACPVYRVERDGRSIVGPSRLGLETEGAALVDGMRIVGYERSRRDEVWTPVYGERSRIRDRYHQMDLRLERRGPEALQTIRLTFRVFNEGVAFRYTVPSSADSEGSGSDAIHVTRERSEFRFSEDHRAWAVYSAQGRYQTVRLSEVRRGCERPLTIQLGDRLFVAIAEAGLVDYARLKLAPLAGHEHALVSSLSSEVEATAPLTTPWRVVMVAESAGQLLEANDLLLNLNGPCAIADTSWIKPGKVIREVTLTTIGGRACVDFAVAHNLQYVEFDAGWYGPENSESSDARTVSLDPARSKGPLDLHAVIRYAEERGIGIILYVNRRALERQLDEILPLYRSWGIKGVKYGFVHVGSQRWTSWLHEAVRKAAKHRLMVDVHDEYRPTGISRTYPNLMTQEGIAGDETRPTNEQTLTLLFTRMLAGAGDNTICYYDARVRQNSSHAYQLAKAVCFYSPWQFLYWYDRPQGSPGRANIGNEPELEFFDAVPTVWDDTRVIHGRIGEYAVIARRSGSEWFIGCMNDAVERTLDVPLSFLASGRAYRMHAYRHDPTVDTRTQVRIVRQTVDAATALRVALAPRSGEAIRLVPVDDGAARKADRR